MQASPAAAIANPADTPASAATTTVALDEPCMGLFKAPFSPRLIALGLLLVALFVGSLVAWTLLAPIKSAVVSPGIISVAGHRKQVQHLEGGIIEKILVRDGEQVAQGQLLIKLRDVHPAAELRQLERQHSEVQAVIARLLAERDERESVDYPEALTARQSDPAVVSVIAGQNNSFLTRKNLNRDKRSVLEHKIIQKQEEISGLAGQIKAKKQERKLIEEELVTVQAALKKNLLPKSEELKLRQRLAQIDGDLSEYQAEIERQRQNILEIRLQISEANAQWLSDITEQLRGQNALLYELSQKIVAAEDVLGRTEIVSPIDGVVVNLQVHTADGVVRAGQPLLEVVPSNDQLIVYAYIDPEDIDELRPGMRADVRLTSFSRRERIPLQGRVSDISPDRISDTYSNNQYYRARIDLDFSSEAVINAHLVAGMGADVFVPTGSRTPLDYLLAPILKNLQFGFKEQ